MSESDPHDPIRADGDRLRSDTMARMMQAFVEAGELHRVAVKHLVLSHQAREGLSRVGIENLRQLVDASDADLARTRYLDAETIAEIRAEQRRMLGA
ncbi:hypothetical protein KTN05_09830 [Paracoccus sp. Z118]|uniref:DNA-directed RNA polymerase subunit alpha C-terminal domain-containing protein n=1 Tax=Paracoccus sp. Z118 TaxID=2851017 RepID=UPI001C2C10B5|nr:DNA-directed RNA polymerase subunit alpha C-terminal domain-containing protein [Paracoccus sp. Z118]MBV0892151.1 hypothetical protein [Paracoccus sp. Z118]